MHIFNEYAYFLEYTYFHKMYMCVLCISIYICIGKENKYAMSDMCIYLYICIDYIVSAM